MDPSAKVNYNEDPNPRFSTKEKSGFVMNRKKFDDNGFTFHSGWNTNNPRRTEYRDLYNPHKYFHNMLFRLSPTNLRKSIQEVLPFEILAAKTSKSKFFKEEQLK